MGKGHELISELFISAEDVFASVIKDFSRLGERKRSAGAVDELKFELYFDALDLLGNRGLTDEVS